ncbi:hypothetical protein BC832DRAFT_399555 [Gaertneriomyces semiglobifer]|nr:hypothetical protein BC832DRAFT_399555 [Gaertneriomyces semiglobifer]
MDRPGRTYRNRSPDSSFESEVESDSFAEATFVTVSESIGRSQGTAVLRKQSTPSLRSQYSDDDRSPLLSARTPMVGYSTVSTSPVRKSRPRLAFLDLIRGVLLIMMIMVNYQPSNKDKKFGWLSHVEWHGWSLADMVFPGLVGIMGDNI